MGRPGRRYSADKRPQRGTFLNVDADTILDGSIPGSVGGDIAVEERGRYY